MAVAFQSKGEFDLTVEPLRPLRELKRTLANRRQQLAALEQLRRIVHRTETRIERSLSSMGTLYSQVLAGQSVSRLADYNHLAAEVDEELLRLQDRLDALHEIKSGRVR